MIDLEVLRENLDIAYTKLSDTTEKHTLQAQLALSFKTDLARAELMLYSRDEVEGSNQKRRDAFLYLHFKEANDGIDYANCKLDKLHLDKELALIEVAHFRALLRIAEIQQVEIRGYENC